MHEKALLGLDERRLWSPRRRRRDGIGSPLSPSSRPLCTGAASHSTSRQLVRPYTLVPTRLCPSPPRRPPRPHFVRPSARPLSTRPRLEHGVLGRPGRRTDLDGEHSVAGAPAGSARRSRAATSRRPTRVLIVTLGASLAPRMPARLHVVVPERISLTLGPPRSRPPTALAPRRPRRPRRRGGADGRPPRGLRRRPTRLVAQQVRSPLSCLGLGRDVR